MPENGSLESELESRARVDKVAEDFFHRYKAVKEYLSKEYHPWIQANCPFFTDHGDLHIQSVIECASALLAPRLPESKNALTPLDLFLILSGILWHDVGNVLGRSGHAQRVTEMTEDIKKLAFPNVGIQRLVEEISRAHAGPSGLDVPKAEEDCSADNRTFTVFPKALAAIVRFADEISENRSRISQALLSKVPLASKIYWEYASCVAASRPDPGRERVIVTIEVESKLALKNYVCPSEIQKKTEQKGKVSLMEYILCRLEKMNNERVYCSREFSRYAPIRDIEVRFSLLKGTQRLDQYELTAILQDSGINKGSYPQIPVYDDFFQQHPEWKCSKLKKDLK